MMDFNIEYMARKHLRQIHTIESDCFAIPWNYESFEEELKNPLAIYVVAVADGEVLGFAGMHHIIDEGHITNVAVCEKSRRQGIGDTLINELINIAMNEGMSGLTLEVRMGNKEAIKLYGKHGFVFEGIRKNYYADTKEDAIIMWKRFGGLRDEKA